VVTTLYPRTENVQFEGVFNVLINMLAKLCYSSYDSFVFLR